MVCIGDDKGWADDGGEDMVWRVGRVVRMAIGELGQEMAQGGEQIEVGAGVQVGGCDGAGGVGYEERTEAVGITFGLYIVFYCVGDVDDLIFLAGGNGDCLHM